MNIVKECQRIRKSLYYKDLSIADNDVHKIASEILNNANEEDKKIMKILNIKVSEPSEKIIEKVKNGYKDNIFDQRTIQLLCIKYNLKYLSLKYYKGLFPSDLIQVIREKIIEKFPEEVQKNGVEKTIQEYNENFKIIAPVSQFNTETVRVFKDPAVCFEFCDEIEIIKKWGNDFSIFRRLSGWIREHANFLILLLWISFLYQFIVEIAALAYFAGNESIIGLAKFTEFNLILSLGLKEGLVTIPWIITIAGAIFLQTWLYHHCGRAIEWYKDDYNENKIRINYGWLIYEKEI